jgi:hypothetical protein
MNRHAGLDPASGCSPTFLKQAELGSMAGVTPR